MSQSRESTVGTLVVSVNPCLPASLGPCNSSTNTSGVGSSWMIPVEHHKHARTYRQGHSRRLICAVRRRPASDTVTRAALTLRAARVYRAKGRDDERSHEQPRGGQDYRDVATAHSWLPFALHCHATRLARYRRHTVAPGAALAFDSGREIERHQAPEKTPQILSARRKQAL